MLFCQEADPLLPLWVFLMKYYSVGQGGGVQI